LVQAPQLYVRLEVMYGRSVTADIVLLVFAPILFGLLATGAIAGAVFRRLSGDRLDLRRALGGLVVSLPRMLIALGLMIAVLGVFGLMMAIILGILSLPLRLASPAVASAVISLLFLLRMLVLYARFYLTIPPPWSKASAPARRSSAARTSPKSASGESPACSPWCGLANSRRNTSRPGSCPALSLASSRPGSASSS
jgi:hypothetical protein